MEKFCVVTWSTLNSSLEESESIGKVAWSLQSMQLSLSSFIYFIRSKQKFVVQLLLLSHHSSTSSATIWKNFTFDLMHMLSAKNDCWWTAEIFTIHCTSVVWLYHLTLKRSHWVKGFLQCNLQHFQPYIQVNWFKSLTKPISEYDCVIWAPYTNKDISLIESFHRRAARFAYNDYSMYSSVTAVLQKCYSYWAGNHHCTAISNWKPSPYMTVTMYKIVHMLIPTHVYLSPVQNMQMKFQQPMTRINFYTCTYQSCINELELTKW